MNRRKMALFVIIALIVMTSGQMVNAQAKPAITASSKAESCSDSQDIAISFMNAYMKYDFQSERDRIKWMTQNNLLTSSFKSQYSKLVTDARKKDPELGLESDPIYDAQDRPDQGFVLKTRLKNGYYVLAGKDWKEFEVTVRLKSQNNRCLVDGAGIINIPKHLRSQRE